MKIGTNASGLLARPDISTLVSDAVTNEADGFSSWWLAQTGMVDSLSLLALAGQATSEIELGTAVVPTWTRHPEAMAAAALTTQAASGGRLVVGLGLAHQLTVEQWWGMKWERPVKHMSEYLAILDSLLESGTASLKGEVWTLERESPIPTADGRSAGKPLVMLAALGEQMLKMAGRRSDGTILWCVGPKTLADQIVPIIDAAADEAGRPTPRKVCSLPVCVTDDPQPTRDFLGKMLADYANLPSYRAMLDIEGVHGLGELSLVGPEDEVSAGLDAISAAGATDFTAVVIGDANGTDRSLELLKSYASA
ncbi:TIGR03564 family F420-dependent LLM class oxidoreductase [Ilumatobacter sp.]|uniref:TIGR03564 family F420-dependent LLM class oxidoreductase n=1 Tax=Ilumatobacter sp. TaxID=1967498 RepID=UPI003C4830B2